MNGVGEGHHKKICEKHPSVSMANHQTREMQNQWGVLLREIRAAVEMLTDPNGISNSQNNINNTNLGDNDRLSQVLLAGIPANPPPLVRQDRYPPLFTVEE